MCSSTIKTYQKTIPIKEAVDKAVEIIADEVEETPEDIREIYERIVAELQNAQ